MLTVLAALDWASGERSVGGTICIEVAVCDVGKFMDVCKGRIMTFMDEFSGCRLIVDDTGMLGGG